MSKSCPPCQILLAEDNPADVGLVRAALREHGIDCELLVIGDGEEALSFIDSLDLDSKIPCPDPVLPDLYRPKRDGNESRDPLFSKAIFARQGPGVGDNQSGRRRAQAG